MAGAADDQEIRTGFEHEAKALCERAFGGAALEVRLADGFGIVQKRLESDGRGGMTWR